MDSKRFQKLALVAAAGALGVALITLMSGEPAERESRAPADRNLAPEQLPPRMTDTDPPAGDLGGVSDPSRILGASEQTLIQRADPETGELKQEFWGSLEPRADGVFDIAEPQARLYLAPWRVIHMRGDRGRFVAPDNHLQSGEFHDDLVITVYEAPRDRPADLAADSADRAVEVRLDHAAFDTTLGEVRSEGDVDLRTPVTGQVHFRGRGLTLVYNDLRNRIDHLEIEHGESLRYDPGAGDGRDAGEADAARTRDARAGSPPDDPERAERSGGPLQYYRVAFEQDVRVTSGDWTVEAERLTVFVTLDGDAAEGRDGVASGGPAEVERRVARRVAELMPLLIGRLGDADAGAAIEEEAAPARASSSAGVDREAVLTWSGRLLMTPLEELPEELAASAAEDRRDLYVRFEGEPIVVRSSGDGDRLACRTIEYLESTRRITARGSAAHPLRIDSAALGTVTAESLTHRLDSGAATLHGAGAIEAADPGNGEAGEASRVLPPDFRLTWTEGVDLSLAAGAEGEGPTGIESATFRGDVRIHDDRFTLRADTLTPRFAAADPEAGGEGERRLEAIEASGGVRVEVEEGWIAANRLLVTSAASGGGRFAPTGIVAEGDARLADPTQRLDARLIEVAVAERDRPADDQAEEADEPDRSLAGQVGVEITSFTARDDVRLALANGAEVRGDRLDADPRDRAATLTGSPVLITRAPDDDAAVPETELEVLQLRIEDNGEVAWSDGPGRFTYTQAATDRDAGPAGRRVAVTWRDRMRFDKQLDTIQVFGQVVTEAEDSPREVNRLTGDELTLELSAAAEPCGARAPDERAGAARGGRM